MSEESPQDFQEIEDADLFMACFELDRSALSLLPSDYHFRMCRRDELALWKRIHFDDPAEAEQYVEMMTAYFELVYAPQGDLFFERCLFACDKNDVPIGTVFIWKAYDAFNTIHWLKVKGSFEGQGIGRALMSQVMRELVPSDYPVYLHTHPVSFRAIKLYADFGFRLLTNPQIGTRPNALEAAVPYLKHKMSDERFATLQMAEAPPAFIQFMDGQTENEF